MINFKIKGLWRGKMLGVIFLTLMVCLMAVPSAKAALIDLGLAGPQNWAALAGDEGILLTGGSEITGVFVKTVGSTGPVALSGSSKIDGTLILKTGETLSLQVGSTIGGLQQNAAGDTVLANAFAAAVAASNSYGAMGTTAGFTGFANITNANNDIDITGKGLVVINVTSMVGLTQDLNITGTATDALVLNLPVAANVPGTLTVVATGVSPLNVLLNSTKVSEDYEMLNDIDGIWLSPFSEFALGSATQIGETVAELIHYHSAALLNNPAVPIPPSAVLLGSGLLGLGIMGRRKWFRKF